MTIDRAIAILTPDTTRYTPREYEEALRMAREAFRYYGTSKITADVVDKRM